VPGTVEKPFLAIFGGFDPILSYYIYPTSLCPNSADETIQEKNYNFVYKYVNADNLLCLVCRRRKCAVVIAM